MERLSEINSKKIVTGDKIYGQIVGVWRKYLRIECLGRDFIIKAKDLQYGYIDDVSKVYKINEQIKVIIKIYKIVPEKRKIYSSLIKILGSDTNE